MSQFLLLNRAYATILRVSKSEPPDCIFRPPNCVYNPISRSKQPAGTATNRGPSILAPTNHRIALQSAAKMPPLFRNFQNFFPILLKIENYEKNSSFHSSMCENSRNFYGENSKNGKAYATDIARGNFKFLAKNPENAALTLLS